MTVPIPGSNLPVLRLSAREFRDLPDYSATLPTGTTIGKRWKRLDGCFDARFIKAGGKPRWIVGEYCEKVPKDEHNVTIRWYRPIVVVGVT